MALVMLPVLIPGVGTADTPSDDSMPGLGSFIVFAFMAVALYFLLKNMNARLRRMSYREKEREAAEREAREADEGTAASGPTVPDLSRGGGDHDSAVADDEGGDGESGPPHTASADPTDAPPSDERGGRSA